MRRKDRVIQLMEVMVNHFPYRGATSYQIAERMGMKPTQHLRCIIQDAVIMGLLVYFSEEHRPNVNRVIYSPTRRGFDWLAEQKTRVE